MYATRQKSQNLALFDFDGTLCLKDSFTQFIFYALPKRRIIKGGCRSLPWIAAYYAGIYPAHKMRPRLFKAMFAHFPKQKLDQLAQHYSQHLFRQLNPELLLQLRRHQQQGDQIVLVSASVDVYLKPLCQALNIELLCSTTVSTHENYTGQYLSADCSGEQKRQRILSQYQPQNYRKIYAYGNSHEDLAMLALADYPFMVGQQIRLPKVASE